MQTSAENDDNEGPNPTDITIGQRLRERRLMLGMSQQQMGKLLGVTFQQIQKYERAANRIAASRLKDIARILNTPTDWFYGDKQEAKTARYGFAENRQVPLDGAPLPALDPDVMRLPETMELVRSYFSLADAKQRRMVQDMIKSMIKAKE